MRIHTFCKLFVALAALVALAAFAQKPVSSTKYDVSKEVTVTGTIEEMKELPVGKESHVHLQLKTATETIEVRLCPTVVLKNFEVTFEKGQQIEVTGSRVKIDDQEVILARQVVSGNSTIVLRDKQGAPVWTWMKKD